jgi:hypothetical protein
MDWREEATLVRTLTTGDSYVVGSGPVWWLIIMALQGHEGPLNEMTIRTAGGRDYVSDDIRRLAKHPDRPRT